MWISGIIRIFLPVFVPPVNIQAPVDLAAFSKPFRSTFFNLGWSSKFALPPWIEMSSLGSSRPHSLVISCIRWSGLVSWATLMYCKIMLLVRGRALWINRKFVSCRNYVIWSWNANTFRVATNICNQEIGLWKTSKNEQLKWFEPDKKARQMVRELRHFLLFGFSFAVLLVC